MLFPKHVNDTKERLINTQDKRLPTLRTLTEPKDKAYTKEYIAMWRSLFKAEQENCAGDSNQWVYDFLDSVVEAHKLPPYFYISKKERDNLITRIQKHTKELEKIYDRNGFNQDIISNDGQFFGGFSSYDIIKDESGTKIIDCGRPPKASVLDALHLFAERAEDEIRDVSSNGKAGTGIEHRRFVRQLAQRNKYAYDRPLYPVIKTAVFALYGVEYEDSDISNLLHRNKRI